MHSGQVGSHTATTGSPTAQDHNKIDSLSVKNQPLEIIQNFPESKKQTRKECWDTLRSSQNAASGPEGPQKHRTHTRGDLIITNTMMPRVRNNIINFEIHTHIR
ncbi:hypothetical protein DPMN_190770 [Dreissena polymorpha]|uniref:Uncharacterized protein n=1 Tax=Dreissena polymorpha TaxID=45954 RepID=A0A9D3Y1T5_DREPO|nr:hypothetical protein DPMN_190770 [Dreissena polymorpha]